MRHDNPKRRRLCQIALLLASAATASVQGAPGTVSEKTNKHPTLSGHVPNIGDSLRSARTSFVGGSSESENALEEARIAALLESSISGDNQQIAAGLETSHIPPPSQENESLESAKHFETPAKEPGVWPCMDDLDKQLIKISLPVIANFAISPVVAAVDLIFINRMGNALAVAGQSAANQVYGSIFWLTSFIPSITAIQVSKEYAKHNEDGVQEAVCRSIFVGIMLSLAGSIGLLLSPDRALRSVLQKDAPALEFARPYLMLRGLAFVPSVISTVGFSAFRGQLDTTTPVRISLVANAIHALLVPLCMFTLSMGLSGAALGTLLAEVVAASAYLYLLARRKLIQRSKLLKLPDLGKVLDLLRGGLALQLRNVAFNLTFIVVTRITQSIDNSGVAPAAHAMALQTFQVGGIVLLALSVVAQTVVPSALVETYDKEQGRMVGGINHARATVNRLMVWGLILGSTLGALQILLLPVILKSTPLEAVREAARLPAHLASILQVINGLVFIGEGVMVGCGNFMQLSISTALAAIGCIATINALTPQLGLTGVWIGFGAFNGIRLLCVWIHQFYTGPLARRATPKKDTGFNEAKVIPAGQR